MHLGFNLLQAWNLQLSQGPQFRLKKIPSAAYCDRVHVDPMMEKVGGNQTLLVLALHVEG